MNNVILGKTIKAMYKLSGKTITQLSDETGLTVDTINNLFYARIQKPGLAGVNALVNAMGFSIQQLMAFLDANPDLSENADITELFTLSLSNAADTAAKPAREAKGKPSEAVELLNAEHEKQLDRFRETHLQYADRLKEQYNRQIEQMQAQNRQMEQHFGQSVEALKSMHEKEIDRLDRENSRVRRTGKRLAIALGIETGLILLLLFLDMLNRNIGWMR